MPLTILIAPDKFKGTLSATLATQAVARGWRRVRPTDRLDLAPMSDGGDGFGSVLGRLCHARQRIVTTVDAAQRKCSARWWLIPATGTAIVESANVIGLAMLPPKRFHPFELDTFGLGWLIRKISRQGHPRCLIGIGGSATNDGGFGLARGLGWVFLDRRQNPIERWIELKDLASLRPPEHPVRFRDAVVAVDVQNPLLGRHGATQIYGPQKGLRSADFTVAERCLRRLAVVVSDHFGRDFARTPGAGAAGGLGFALNAFLGARFAPGFELFARHAHLRRRIRSADLVLTGEGAIDHSTLMGKGVGQIAALCREAQIPCIGLAGSVSPETKGSRLFTRVLGLTELTSLLQAKTCPALWLERLAAHVARETRLR